MSTTAPASVRRRRRHLVAVAAVSTLALGLVGLVASAQGASPTAGDLTDTHRSVSWTGGPLAGADPGALLGTGPLVCLPASCDEFALKVATPAGYGTTHNLTISLTSTSPSGQDDFDLYLVDQGGNVVASSAEAGDESLTIPVPAPGTYSADVVAYTAAGGTYTASATISDAAGPTPGPGPGPVPTDPAAPGYATYAAPSALPGANDAGEPSIGNHNTPASQDPALPDPVMYQAGLHTYKVLFDDTVTPATATWSDVTASATVGCLGGNTTGLDPILFTDPLTGRTFESQLTGQDSLTCYTDDDGATWNPSQGGGLVSGVDHQTIGGGPYSPDDLVGGLPVNDYPHAVYYCSQDIATALCAVSHDGGTTFPVVNQTYTLADCGGLHGHIRIAPDGTAYLPNKSCTDADGNRTAAVVVSTDGGLSWTVKPVTGSTAGDSDPSVGIGRDGTAYVGYVGADGKPGAAVSPDRGDTWIHHHVAGASVPCTGAADVAPCSVQSAVFPTVIAGDDDRAAFAYLGTTTPGDYQATGVFTGVWHLYVDTTYDGGATWVTTDATPTDPVQRGSICTGGTTCGDDRNLLDFIDITHDDHGRVEVGFADGCIAACATDPTSMTHDSYSTIARQTTGRTLFAKYDPATGPTDPTTDPPAPTNTRPVARIALGSRLVAVDEQLRVSGSGSRDAETPGRSLTYAWDFGDAASPRLAGGLKASTTFTRHGAQTVTLTVTDADGLTDTATTTVQVGREHGCGSLDQKGTWRTRKAAGASGSRYCESPEQQAGRDRSSLATTFRGSLLGIAFGTVKGGGTARVLVDGQRVRTLDFGGATGSPRFGRDIVVGGLGAGSHTLEIVVRGRAVVDSVTY
ncbi:PKD domain-containing protein [Nocardioides rubriscoriae]|uniref:PKD domain-containing protein n=1 Tax=Nocardioides rubriscoriae TaxID=642762 RepID=UPI0011DF800D|nr:PKD domain-containing protein [Nocardioides rubriscoriae]